MQTFQYIVKDPVGLHARPAGMLVNEAKKYKSKITIIKNGKMVDATKLMLLMSMGIRNGEEITVEILGEDEEEASTRMKEFFEEHI